MKVISMVILKKNMLESAVFRDSIYSIYNLFISPCHYQPSIWLFMFTVIIIEVAALLSSKSNLKFPLSGHGLGLGE